jgi:CBS domain-containing protein
MKIAGPAKRLTVYFGESDHWRSQPLWMALLETLRRSGLAGATVVRATGGFGAHSRIKTASILELSQDLPLVLEMVDTAEQVDHALALIAPMVREGLITTEDVTVVKYSHRYLAPLPGDRPVRDFMHAPVVTATPQGSLLEAWTKMVEHGLKALPVVGPDNRPAGMLSDGDLMERTGLVQRLAIAERLDAGTLGGWREALAADSRTVGQVMTQPAETIGEGEPLAHAAARMSTAGRKRLVVVDRDGGVTGILSRFDVLSAVAPAAKGKKRERPLPGALRTVGEVMDRNLPAVPEDADLAEVVEAMLKGGYKRVIVVDAEGRPLGLISDGDLVARVRPEARSGLLRALARRERPPEDVSTARQLMSAGILGVPPEMPVGDAIQRAVANRRKRLVVVDEKGRAVGILDRQDLLRSVVG